MAKLKFEMKRLEKKARKSAYDFTYKFGMWRKQRYETMKNIRKYDTGSFRDHIRNSNVSGNTGHYKKEVQKLREENALLRKIIAYLADDEDIGIRNIKIFKQ